MGVLSRIFRPSAAKAAEGSYRPGPWMTLDGLLPASWGKYANYWQLGRDPIQGNERLAIVEACVSAYAQTIAMCPGDHWRTLPNGGRERVTNSALSRVLRRPNDYQSISDFLLNLTRHLYSTGNAYAVAIRNDRSEIAELHLMDPRHCGAKVATTGDVFYGLGGNELLERRLSAAGANENPLAFVPSRDVLHVRLHTPRHPLRGETPLSNAALDVSQATAMGAQQLAFYGNQSRPSGVLQTDMVLTPEQATQLRERWNEQSQGLNAGGMPILTAGLKFQSMSLSAQDAQFAEVLKLTEQHIALAFRVPLQILGIGGTPYASTELLMQSWIASGLGFAINHIEQAFDGLFRLNGYPSEYVEFDTEILMRSALKDRMEGYARGVQGGIYAPNEARLKEGLPAMPDGDEPRVQQQVVPLSWHKDQAEMKREEMEAAAAQAVQPAPAPVEEDDDNAERHAPEQILHRLYDRAASLH